MTSCEDNPGYDVFDSREAPEPEEEVSETVLAGCCPICGNQEEENERGFVPPITLTLATCEHFGCKRCVRTCDGCKLPYCTDCSVLCLECALPICAGCKVVHPDDSDCEYHEFCAPAETLELIRRSDAMQEHGDQQYRSSIGD